VRDGLGISVLFKLSFSIETIQLTAYLTRQIEALNGPQLSCPFCHALQAFQDLDSLLQVCGHDTAELGSAIMATQLAVQTLKDARVSAVYKFNSEGMLVALAGQDTPAAQVDDKEACVALAGQDTPQVLDDKETCVTPDGMQ
jgi:hypothetical protein